eukprot:8168055-Lingulodinium_polyedra.AAC.1
MERCAFLFARDPQLPGPPSLFDGIFAGLGALFVPRGGRRRVEPTNSTVEGGVVSAVGPGSR